MTKPDLISRRSFLRSGASLGGGLFVAAFASEIAVAATLADATPGPSAFKPSAYIEIGNDGQITFTIGKSEMGQGTMTGITQLLADELGCDWQTIRIVQAPAAPEFGFPFNGFMITGGSSGLRTEWMRMRTMGASARIMLVEAAAEIWGVDAASLSVAQSVVTGPAGQTATFAELADAASKRAMPDNPVLKEPSERTFIGKTMKRVDTRAKIEGRATYGIDVDLPGMVTAICIAPPQMLAPIVNVQADRALARPGITAIVPISTGVAIVGDHYWAVQSARDDIEIVWGESPFAGIGSQEIRQGYREALNKPGKVAEMRGNPAPLPDAVSVTREFEQPYLAHACMEPMNFTVSITGNGAEVWGPTQAQTMVQNTIADVAGIDPKDVRVHTTFLGGGFGRRSAQDFVRSAAEIAKSVGKPVKLVYSREDDMRSGRYRPYNLTRATGTLDKSGKLATLDVKIATPAVSKWSGLTFLIRDGIDQQAVEGLVNLPYDIPNVHVEWVDHDPGIPVHFWRAVGSSHNPFVIESLMDDLAGQIGEDPLIFRQAMLSTKPRHLKVLRHLAEDANWDATAPQGVGRGMAIVQSFESIVAQAVEISIRDGDLSVDKVTCVIDCGVAVNPGQIEAQMHSSIIFGLSALLRGEITLTDGAIDQSNFHDYEPIRMPEIPDVKVRIIEGSDKPGGVGEPGLPPLAPAVGNALFALTGERTTRLPLVS